MSKTIDLSAKLTNERPKLKLADDKIYEIDNRKNTVIQMEQKLQNANINDLGFLDEAIKMLLGDKASKEIDEMDLSIADYQRIFIAIFAAIQEIKYEQAEELFRKATDL